MDISNADYMQATIELFGFVITMLVAMVFWIITGNSKKSTRNVFIVFLLSGVALLLDAGWYIYDGDTSSTGLIINQISNIGLFVINPIMIFFTGKYIRSLIEESGCTPHKFFIYSTIIVPLIAFLLPLTNPIHNWIYCFTEDNVYSRLDGWYIYTAFSSLALVMCLIMVLVYRKRVALGYVITLAIFVLAPFIGIVLQMTVIGISFIQIGTSVGCLGIVVSNLISWVKNENKNFSEGKKRLWITECGFGIMILFVSAAFISCYVSVYNISRDNSEQNSTAVTFMVSQTIDSYLSEPLNVARTMAQSHTIIEALSSTDLEGTKEESEMLEFMQRVQKEYNFQTVFVASEKTKAYYTCDGLARYMHPDTDALDSWYKKFTKKGVKYEYQIGSDLDSNMALTVFVNMDVRNSSGKRIGVCGIGMSLNSLMSILSRFENEYGLEILLTDGNGIINVATSANRLGQNASFSLTSAEETGTIAYERNTSKARTTQYIQGLNWYLVIDDINPDKEDIIGIMLPSLSIYILAVIFMIVISLTLCIRDRMQNKQFMITKQLSETDSLTGLMNRLSMDKYIDGRVSANTAEPLTVLMIDVNGLKHANDNIGHDAGDELLVGTARCLSKVFEGQGNVYRNGGDEFAVISTLDEASVWALVEKLKEETATWSGQYVENIALAVGLASNDSHPECTVQELMKIADGEMYKDKDRYYKMTGMERRKRYILKIVY